MKTRQIGFVSYNYRPKHKGKLSKDDIKNNAIYYLYYNFNEYLAYYYAAMGHDKEISHCTHLLGVCYELGIFVPISLNYASYFYSQANSSILENFKHINPIKPKLIKLKLNSTINPSDDLILGLGLISIDNNNYIHEGLNIIKNAAKFGYIEASYVLGCLLFDVKLNTSIIYNQNRIIHLQANQDFSYDYLNEATSYGHELSLFILATYFLNKDENIAMMYLNKLYENHQYEFIKNLDFTDKNFINNPRLFLNNIKNEIINPKDNKSAIISKIIVAIMIEKLNNCGFFFKKEKDSLHQEILDIIASNYQTNNDNISAYEIMKLEALFGIMNDSLYYIANINNASNFELDRLENHISLSTEEWNIIVTNICKYHRHLKAVDFCRSCGAGLCIKCANEHHIYSVSAEEGLPYCNECYYRII